jgi:hypothetical protein
MIECPVCRAQWPEGVTDCPRCADRVATRAFLARVPDGPLRARLDAAELLVLDVILSDALAASDGNRHEVARRLQHRWPGVFEMMRALPHLAVAFPASPGTKPGATAARVRDEHGRLRGRAPAAAPTPAAPTATTATKPRRRPKTAK